MKESLTQRLAKVPDHRKPRGIRHSLPAVLNLVAAGVMAGMNTLAAISEWGRELTPTQAADLGFTRRPPCKATLSIILARLSLPALAEQLQGFAADLARREPIDHLALDGKRVRGASAGDVPAVHLLALYATRAGAVIAQTQVGEKTNEHKAGVAMMAGRELDGAVVTADAMFTHRDFCGAVVAAGGGYALPAEDNQPTLKRDVAAAFAPPPEGLSPPTDEEIGRRRDAGRDGGSRPRADRAAVDPGHDRVGRLPARLAGPDACV